MTSLFESRRDLGRLRMRVETAQRAERLVSSAEASRDRAMLSLCFTLTWRPNPNPRYGMGFVSPHLVATP